MATILKPKPWLLAKIKSLSRAEIIRNYGTRENTSMIGKMFFFFYDAKGKGTLPYWDAFPLVIPIEQYDDGFLGINTHYLPMRDRLVLLKQLTRFATGKMTDDRTRLQLSYPLLKSVHSLYRATPCIKRYLYPHIRSRFAEVPTHEWEIAATVPVQNFRSLTQPITAPQVWAESASK